MRISKKTQARTCVYVGTFNTDANSGETVEYLNPGDRRRWWPVRVGTINIDALVRDRDQLFAEAVSDFKLGDIGEFTLALPREFWPEATAIQIEREKPDAFEDTLATLYATCSPHRSLISRSTSRT